MTTAATRDGRERPSPAAKPPSRRRLAVSRRRVGLITGAVALLAVLLYIAVLFKSAITVATALRDLASIATTVSPTDPGRTGPSVLERANSDLATTAEELTTIKHRVQPLLPLLSSLQWFPGWGKDLAAAPHLLLMGEAAAQAGAHGLKGLTPALTALQGHASTQDILKALSSGSSKLSAAQDAAARVSAERAAIGPVAPLHPALQSALGQVDAQLPRVEKGLALAVLLPHMLGVDQAKSYLLLGQNNDELRATGGFISTAGILTMDQGEVKRFDYRDSYAFDSDKPRLPRIPPVVYRRYMLFQDWRFRDSNWWADYPTSARQAEAFLFEEQGELVHGVIAFDQWLLGKILTVLGPVDILAFGERVDASNFTTIIEIYAHPPGYKEGDSPDDLRKVQIGDRKAFIRELADVLLARVDNLQPSQWLQLAQYLEAALAEKHLLLYLHDGGATQLARAQGWDGAVSPPSEGDFLMAVETNVGYSKANRYVERTMDYTVTLGPGPTPESAKVTLTYQNTNGAPARQCTAEDIDFYTSDDSCYKTYLRLYVPLGSMPISAKGLDSALDRFSEGGATVLAGLVVLPPAATKQVEFTYQPPRSILRAGSPGLYQLILQKQPGTDSLPTTFTLSLLQQPGQSSSSPNATNIHRQLSVNRDEEVRILLP